MKRKKKVSGLRRACLHNHFAMPGVLSTSALQTYFTFSSRSEGGTGVSGLSTSADWPFFLSAFLSFPFPVPGSPDLGRRGTNGILGRQKAGKHQYSLARFPGAVKQ